MSGIHTEIVESAHVYTRANVPWETAVNRAAHGETSTGFRFNWRLFHYLSSGGMRTFGRTVEQMQAARRQRRLVVFAVVFAAVWTILYFT